MEHIGEKEPEKPVFPHESIEHLMAGGKSSKKLWKTGLCVMDDPGLIPPNCHIMMYAFIIPVSQRPLK